MIGKWNYETKEYDPYTPDPEWNVVLYTPEMDLAVNCASCGNPMEYGQSFTSLEIHNGMGLGYPVCENCYDKEHERRKAHK